MSCGNFNVATGKCGGKGMIAVLRRLRLHRHNMGSARHRGHFHILGASAWNRNHPMCRLFLIDRAVVSRALRRPGAGAERRIRRALSNPRWAFWPGNRRRSRAGGGRASWRRPVMPPSAPDARGVGTAGKLYVPQIRPCGCSSSPNAAADGYVLTSSIPSTGE